MSLKDIMQADAENIILNLDDTAREEQYTPKSTGTPLDIKLIVQPGVGDEESGNNLRDVGRLFVLKSDVALPAYDDQVTWEGDTWYVRRIIKDSGAMWTVELHKDKRPGWG